MPVLPDVDALCITIPLLISLAGYRRSPVLVHCVFTLIDQCIESLQTCLDALYSGKKQYQKSALKAIRADLLKCKDDESALACLKAYAMQSLLLMRRMQNALDMR